MSADFSKPQKVDDLALAFGGDIKKLLPPMSSIPEEFQNMNDHTKWNKLMSKWFFSGLPEGTEFYPKDGIDPSDAIRHLRAILGSWEPKHEHKTAGVAYLMSLWFNDYKLPEEKAQA